MTDVLQDYEQAPSRPTFITVLCILTFIGSGWSIINESIKYFTAGSQAAVIAQAKENASSNLERNKDSDQGVKFAKKMVGAIDVSVGSIKNGAIAGVAAGILCLAGAFMMWNLKKTGFYLYLAGILTGIISPFIIFGGSNFVSIIVSVLTGVVGLVFVILYAVNLKYMK